MENNPLVADRDRHQWFTPVWAAKALVTAHFGDLTDEDIVVEPTCGSGNFLTALPKEISAFGVEVDAALADLARRNSGRMVLEGDFRTVELPSRPTAAIGNPPFNMDVFDGILDRCHDLMDRDGRAGFILPAYAFQTASRVASYARRWSLEQEMIPRNLFPGMSKPLCFAVFRKDGLGHLRGFALYRELHDVHSMPDYVADELNHCGSAWSVIVSRALEELGGSAALSEIYAAVEPRRPTGNSWWREKIRQTLSRSSEFVKLDRGYWSINKDAMAA
ncbi:class I SAM-dependent methyltransferase [Roseibium sp. RKSG952]|uniref:class I SAM-dependent methyltransferase n=1 Tax=Roseibium sp. RKSG952 TaxID=2529384 RepID=UPI0012BC8700|nr:class I SAM-dependent methyltransferase [Roseibium sp. RKSG952]MTH95492.1 class I SAM-dependent methyltransferase [Roseibium sp. RKSG952]